MATLRRKLFLQIFFALTILPHANGQCFVLNPDWIGDGFCDTPQTGSGSGYNTPQCNWDGGDCCPETCIDNLYTCGLAGYVCERPETEVCEELLTCDNCASKPQCGWCATTQKCLPGDQFGPTNSSCPLWERYPPQCDQHSPTFWVSNVSVPMIPAAYGPDSYIHPPISSAVSTVVPVDACANITTDLTGKIALVRPNPPNTCFFADMTLNVQNAGAVAMVIYVDLSRLPNGIQPITVGAPPSFNQSQLIIPTVKISGPDGQKIVNDILNSTSPVSALLGLVAEGPLYFNTSISLLPDQGIILFDPNYVATHDEGGRTLQGLESIRGANATVLSPFHLFAPTLANSPKYAVIPSQSAGAVEPFLSVEERAFLVNYVNGGGSLTLTGDKEYNAVLLINQVFGLSVEGRPGACADNSITFSASSIVNSTFSDSPNRLQNAFATYCVLSTSLPENTAAYIHITSGTTVVPVFQVKIGSGSVTYIGFDFSVFPTPLGWLQVLERATNTCLGGSCTDTNVTPNNTALILGDSTITTRASTSFLDIAFTAIGVETKLVNITDYTKILLAAPVQYEVVVIPKFTEHHLNWRATGASNITENMKSYVNKGGNMIVVGSRLDFETNLLNDAFGWKLYKNLNCRRATRNPIFPGNPQSFSGFTETSCIGNLPENSSSIYITENKFYSMVSVMSYGSGKVFYVGYDFESSPTPLEVEELLAQIVSNPSQFSNASSVEQALQTKNSVSCGKTTVNMTCPTGFQIDILSVSYRISTDADTQNCNPTLDLGTLQSVSCEATAFKGSGIIESTCQGQTQCQIEFNEDSFISEKCDDNTAVPVLSASYQCIQGTPLYTNIGKGFCRDEDLARPNYCNFLGLSELNCASSCSRYRGCQSFAFQELFPFSNCWLYFDLDDFEIPNGWNCNFENIGSQVTRVQSVTQDVFCHLRSRDLGCRTVLGTTIMIPTDSSNTKNVKLLSPVANNDARFARLNNTSLVATRRMLTGWEYFDGNLWLGFISEPSDVILGEIEPVNFTLQLPSLVGIDGGIVSGYRLSTANISVNGSMVRMLAGEICVQAPPTASPTSIPSTVPTTEPTEENTPTAIPTTQPTDGTSPTTIPTSLPTAIPTADENADYTVDITISITIDEVTEEFRIKFKDNLSKALQIAISVIGRITFSSGSVVAAVTFQAVDGQRKPFEVAQDLSQRDITQLSTDLEVPVQSISEPKASDSQSSSSNEGESDNTAVVAGAVVGFVAVSAVGLCVFWYIRKKRRFRQSGQNRNMAAGDNYDKAFSHTPSINNSISVNSNVELTERKMGVASELSEADPSAPEEKPSAVISEVSEVTLGASDPVEVKHMEEPEEGSAIV